MPLAAPDLDDRKYDDLVKGILTLVPRYTPEWRDVNDSDPGMALAKLYAWMTELQLWRMNQVPERSYIKFLQMVGIERMPATPARTEITFTSARDDVPEMFVPVGTQVAAPADADGPILFETTRPLTVLGTKLKAVQVFDGFGWSIETTKAQAVGQWFYPFGPKARESSALHLGFGGKSAFTDQEIDIAVWLPGADTSPKPYMCGDPAAALAGLPLAARIVWEYRDLTSWQPLELVQDDTRAFTKSGHVTLRGPGALAIKSIVGDVPDALYWVRGRLDSSQYEKSPRLATVAINTVPAIQATTYQDEVLGASNGRPDQRFTVANTPVLPFDQPDTVAGAYGHQVTIKNLRLEIDEGDGFQAWQQVDDFYASGPEDPHFTLNRTTGEVAFGDGRRFGRVPLAFVSPSAAGNIVARLYRAGGARRGNIPAGSVTEIQSYLPGVDTAANLFAAQGGTDEESTADAKIRAAGEINSNCRAVTAADFEIRALEAGVRRAKALALTHPGYPGARIPGSVTVIVVPDGDAPNPIPNEATLAAVCAYLNSFRLVTTELHIVAPTYRKVRIEVDISVKRNANLATVQTAVQTRLNQFFSPLTGGADGTGWPFGGVIYFSDVYRQILDTPNVDRIADGQLVIRVDGEAGPFCRDIELCPGELTYAVDHDIRVSPTASGGT
jgi:predicted phage baseplate assembly protein